MSPNLMHALVAEHQHELERQVAAARPPLSTGGR